MVLAHLNLSKHLIVTLNLLKIRDKKNSFYDRQNNSFLYIDITVYVFRG